MRHPIYLPLSALLLLLAGCASVPLEPGCERFGRDGQVCLLPPSALPALDGSRLVTVTRDGQAQSFMGLLHIDDRNLRLVGLSLLGTGIFSLVYDGHDVTAQPADSELHPERLVVMLELAVADPGALQPRLRGLELKTGEKDGLEARDVYEHGELLAHIERSQGPLTDATLSISVPPLKLSVLMKPMPASTSP
ncbi:MAG TPA: DUF3261 domain-containing protein [Gammaproteobacteria bacterium]|nr:DUF3261 domain-containing protein [Gammaproteobacteria bacterium]